MSSTSLFAFFISLSFANPENVMGSEISLYSSGLSQFQKGNFHQAALIFRSIHSSSSDSRAKKRASYLLAHSLAHTNKIDESIKFANSCATKAVKKKGVVAVEK